MGKVDDYINSLDGQENLDITEVVAELAKLHNEEVTTRDAKIAELTTSNETHVNTIAEKDGEITQWKAKNWDLVNQLPADGQTGNQSTTDENTGLPNASNITLDNMFQE